MNKSIEAAQEKELNINPLEAIVLASEAKGHLNGVLTNVIHDNLVEYTGTTTNIPEVEANQKVKQNGVDNKAYIPEEVPPTDALKYRAHASKDGELTHF